MASGQLKIEVDTTELEQAERRAVDLIEAIIIAEKKIKELYWWFIMLLPVTLVLAVLIAIGANKIMGWF